MQGLAEKQQCVRVSVRFKQSRNKSIDAPDTSLSVRYMNSQFEKIKSNESSGNSSVVTSAQMKAVLGYLEPLMALFMSEKFCMKSTAVTCAALFASSPVKRPMPAPSSRICVDEKVQVEQSETQKEAQKHSAAYSLVLVGWDELQDLGQFGGVKSGCVGVKHHVVDGRVDRMLYTRQEPVSMCMPYDKYAQVYQPCQ